MSKILVFGHQNPDTDAITSAISYAYLLNQLGEEAEPVALGPINDETQYALDKFNVEAPRAIQTAANETEYVALVDHNEFQQSVSDIRDVTIHSVVDHHRVGNFETAQPLAMTLRPLGCCQSVVYGLYKENNIDIPAHIAGLMLSGIISDTLLFSSPTCTAKDREIAKDLAAKANVDIESYGTAMLRSGADVSGRTAKQIVDGDAKSFPMGDYTIRIGQVNVVDHQDVLSRKQEMLDEMAELSEANHYDAFLLVITNILTNDSEGLYFGKDELKPKVESAFNATIKSQQLALPGVVSRKKQIVPPLTKAIEK